MNVFMREFSVRRRQEAPGGAGRRSGPGVGSCSHAERVGSHPQRGGAGRQAVESCYLAVRAGFHRGCCSQWDHPVISRAMTSPWSCLRRASRDPPLVTGLLQRLLDQLDRQTGLSSPAGAVAALHVLLGSNYDLFHFVFDNFQKI